MRDVVLPVAPAEATTALARARGLLGRPGAPDPAGLWIAPCKQVHTFGMRPAIDVVFLGPDHRVLHCAPAMRPWRLSRWVRQAAGALELPAGTIDACGLAVGVRVVWAAA